MLGLLGLVIINAKKLSNHIKENVGFQIVLKDTTTQAELDILKQEISSSAFTKQGDYISKDAAAKKLQQDLGEDFISFLGYNPLLSSLDVKLNSDYANIDSLAGFEKQIMQKHFVKEVIYHKGMIKQVNDNAKLISLYILIFSGLLLVVAVALINNTIRLSIYAKRFNTYDVFSGSYTRFYTNAIYFKGSSSGYYCRLSGGFFISRLFIIKYTLYS